MLLCVGGGGGFGRDFGSVCSLLGYGTFARIAGFLLFAQTALFDQFFFLAAHQFGLAAGIFFAAGQFGFFRTIAGGCFHFDLGFGCAFDDAVHAIFTLDEGAFFTHFHLDGAGTTGGVGLFNFAGRFFHQGDFLAFQAGSAMAGLQKA